MNNTINVLKIREKSMMKKQYYFYLGISVLLFGMVGCGTKSSEQTVIPQVIVESVENAKVLKTTEKITVTPTSMTTEPLLELSVKDVNAMNRMLSTDAEMALYGQSLFCVDETSGVTYFVNQGKNYYLYQIKDGKVELVVDMPVKEVYPYGGLVYFMVEDYNIYDLEDIHSGDIYCYCPESNAVELIYPAGAMEGSKDHRLTVEESGIYFSYISEKDGGVILFYHLPFHETEPVKDTKNMTFKGWNNYYLLYYNYRENLFLNSREKAEDGTREQIKLPAITKTRYCIIGDNLFSVERGYISCINLETQIQTKYDFLEAIQDREREDVLQQTGVRIMEDFVVTEDAIWITTGHILYRMDLQSKEVSFAYIRDENNKPYYITELYTDGKNVYGSNLVYYRDKSVNVVHILIDEIKEETQFGMPLVKVEQLTK